MIHKISINYFILAVLFATLIVGTAEASGDILYFSTSGNDNGGNNDCTNYNNPCRTIQRAEQVATPNSKLLFKEGDAWTLSNKFDIDHNGITVGAWHGNGVEGTSGNRPVFQGAADPPNVAGSGYPTVTSGTLIKIGQDITGVTIENVEVRNSWCGTGINNGRGSNSLTIRNVYLHDTYGTGLALRGNGNIVEKCEIKKMGWGWRLYDLEDGWAQTTSPCDDKIDQYQGTWPGGINLMDGGTNALVRYNHLYDTWSEGISPASGSIVEYNVIGNTQSVGVYMNAANDVTVRYNLVYGTSDANYHSVNCGGGFTGHGIGTNHEETGQTAGHNNVTVGKIYGNIIINRCGGINYLAQDIRYPVGGYLTYNNTIIDCKFNVRLGNNAGAEVANVFKNNISYITYDDGSGYPSHIKENSGGVVVASNNLWFDKTGAAAPPAPGSDFYSANQRLGDPNYDRTVWRGIANFDSLYDFTSTDYIPRVGGDGINNGVVLDSEFDKIFLEGTNFHVNPINPTIILGDQDNYGNWDIGAFVFTGSPDKTLPAKPTGLMIIE